MKDIETLENQIKSLDIPERGCMLELVGKIKEAHQRRRRIIELIQGALQQLRLDMKYLIFDLEATRRERDRALGK